MAEIRYGEIVSRDVSEDGLIHHRWKITESKTTIYHYIDDVLVESIFGESKVAKIWKSLCK